MMKKLYLALIAVALAAIVTAAVVSLELLHITGVIRYPAIQSVSINLGNIPAGYTVSKNVTGVIVLPAKYTLTFNLTGTLNEFSSVVVNITFVQGTATVASVILTQSTTQQSVTLPAGNYNVIYTVTVTPTLNVYNATSIVTAQADLVVDVSVSA